eukprot:5599751-Pyramimonas_sp.AAC.1
MRSGDVRHPSVLIEASHAMGMCCSPGCPLQFVWGSSRAAEQATSAHIEVDAEVRRGSRRNSRDSET